MSKYEQKEGDIAIFLNKIDGNKPIFTGKAMIDGKIKDVALWPKKDTPAEDIQKLYDGLNKINITMLRGSIKDEWKPDFDEAKKTGQSEGAYNEDDDEIPF